MAAAYDLFRLSVRRRADMPTLQARVMREASEFLARLATQIGER